MVSARTGCPETIDHEDPKDTKTGCLEATLQPVPAKTNAVSREVVDAALAVHSQLGAGLLESVYEICLAHELRERRMHVSRQVSVPVVYKRQQMDVALRIDLLVEHCLVVEVKAVETLAPIHTAQVLTYLKLSGHRLGLLMNFNVRLLRDGIKRIVL
jgi:GxxExxY protein